MAWKDRSPKWYKVSKFVVCDLLKTIKSEAWIKFRNNAWEFAGRQNWIISVTIQGIFIPENSSSKQANLLRSLVEGNIELQISEWKEDFFL